MWLNWKVIRFVAGVLGLVVFCVAVMSAGVLSQLGAGLSETAPTLSDTSTPDTSTPSTDDQDQDQAEGSFWDNVAASSTLKGQIDRAATTGDCDTLNTVRNGYKYGGVVLAGGVDAETDGGETTRQVQAYIAAEAIKAGCELE